MKKVILTAILLGTLLWAVEPYAGAVGPVDWWVSDKTGNLNIRGLCVINDSVAWVVGKTGQVWKRIDGVHDHHWNQVTNLPSGYYDYDFNDVYFVTLGTGWIVGEKRIDGIDRYKGVVYRTTNDGTNWTDQTGNISPPLPLPTPFLKVKFANVNYGYISCGNGVVLKTENGGSNWSRTTSDPWNDQNNISVWYDGLWVDPSNSNNIWVDGDAYGFFCKSTNGGSSWDTTRPAVFKQTYTFPSGTSSPHDTRLANFDLEFTNINNGLTALSYGKIGKTTNGGTNWDTTCYEPNPTWFYDVAHYGSNNFTGGNYGIAHRFNGTHTQEHFNYRWLNDNSRVDFASFDASSSTYTYGAGDGGGSTGGSPVRQRYKPGDFTIGNINVVDVSDSNYYRITIHWSFSNGRNGVKSKHFTLIIQNVQ
jgi:photosystem II stability/assembly factor-like uncharacterized protein